MPDSRLNRMHTTGGVMGDVVDLDDHRPHVTGIATCMGCAWSWVAVVDERADMTTLECPSCSKPLGALPGALDDAVYACACDEHQAPHLCPYMQEVHSVDGEPCTCCDACVRRCWEDV